MVEGSKAHSKRKRGLKGALEREVRLGNTLPREWKMKSGGKIQRFFQVA
jgi:hypothetical protein